MEMTATAYQIPADTYKAILSNGLDELDFESADFIDLDKSWHVISYLVSGNAEAGFHLGGETLGKGKEKFLVFSAKEVSDLAGMLATDKLSQFLDKFDAKDLNSKAVYPGTWDSWSRDGFVKPHINELSVFLANVSDENRAMVLVIG